jgi:hypothetical protein
MTEPPGFCGVCGWPLAAPSCAACGASAGDVPALEDYVDLSILGGARPEDYPELKNAFLAWQQKDWNRMIGQCLVALGVESPQITPLPEGQGWAFVQDSAVIYLSTDKARSEVAIESPMVRVSARLRVPLFRTLLELNDRALGAARFCLRGDLVVLRFADRLTNVAPPKLVAAIRELALRADGWDDLLALTFSARMVGPEAQRRYLAWTFLGTPLRLANLGGSDLPPLAMPSVSSTVPESGAAPEGGPAAASAASPTSPNSAVAARLPIDPAVAARLQIADALCDLFRATQALQKPLLFMTNLAPAVPLLLQRALLFRVYDEYRETCPDVVSLLMRSGKNTYGQLWEPAQPGFRDSARGAEGFGIAAPSALTLDSVLTELIRSRAQVGPQSPCVPELFRSVVETKETFRKYLEEIEKGPRDLAFRHFLLLGAFAELLHRTRLPAPTAERLRNVMTEGKRRGASADAVAYLIERMWGVLA